MTSRPEKNQEKQDSKKGVCEYHLCKKETTVYKCKYCGRYFCKEHLQPKPAGLPRFNSTSYEDRLFMEEWHKPGGHPCVPYLDVWKAKIHKKQDEYIQSLNKLNSKHRESTYSSGQEQTNDYHETEDEDFLRTRVSRRVKSKRKNEENLTHNAKDVKDYKVIKTERKRSYMKYIILGFALIFLILAFSGFKDIAILFGVRLNCSDGTLYDHCSKDKPLYCFNGTLINKATICGCPYDYRPKGDDCEVIPRCEDGTIYGECSVDKPLYCLNGTLVKKASLCGCPYDEVAQGDECISKYEVGPSQRTFTYVFDWKVHRINFTVYEGLKKYLSKIPRHYYCDPDCPSDRELELRYLDEPIQKKYLIKLVDEIRFKTNNSDDQVRIAINLIQHIPYDREGFETNNLNNRYPYEVLYDMKGVCAEKSRLLAFILRELGYGVVLFSFEPENHMAVGIKCPLEYSYKNTSYCFIETTTPTIPTYADGDYVGAGKLTSDPEVIFISDGKSFDSISEEYQDAQDWIRLNELSESHNGYLSRHNWFKWRALMRKYGIEVNESHPV